jgi:hypothetical protein
MGASLAYADWPSDDTQSVSLDNSPGHARTAPMSVSDGAGGAIVAWQDNRSGGYRIYAQRVSASGARLWSSAGVAIVTGAGLQTSPVLVSDGQGGAIIAWIDVRAGNIDIYSQRVNAAGATQWSAGGVALCTASGDQTAPTIISDGASGAIVTWTDARGADLDLYAQRITAAGAPAWTANGAAVCAAAGVQWIESMVSDGAGGAIIAWSDLRSLDLDIYVQHMNSAGTASWVANGTPVCQSLNDQRDVQVVADGFGGVWLVWDDQRNQLNRPDIYGQHMSSIGTNMFPVNGIPLCSGVSGDHTLPVATTDGSGGIFVAWDDDRNGVGHHDVGVQHMTSAGVNQLSAGGQLLTTDGFDTRAQILADGHGGAQVVYLVATGAGTFNLDVRMIDGKGNASAGFWGNAWRILQYQQPIADAPFTLSPDDAGGAVVSWPGTTLLPIRCQHFDAFGLLGSLKPAVGPVADVPGDQGGSVSVRWTHKFAPPDAPLDSQDSLVFRVWRSVPVTASTQVRALARGITNDWRDAATSGRLLADPAGATGIAWEYLEQLTGDPNERTYTVIYTRNEPTASDSIGGSNPGTAFMVQATYLSSLFAPISWFSDPDSGYSVDNLAPATVSGFTGQYQSGAVRLHWQRNLESDLAGYHLYRGTTPGFPTDPAHLIAAKRDTGFVDTATSPQIYAITAIDIHGNESFAATWTASGALGVPGRNDGVFALGPPMPNPARGLVHVHFTLARSGPVRLTVHDVAGRLVRTLIAGEQEAGEHVSDLTLADDTGRSLASGVYLVRLEAQGRVATRRLAAIR